jgi:DNA-directed RNA polymerase subunit H (RpoH/RPB5)
MLSLFGNVCCNLPVKKHERVTMKSLLSEAERKEILEKTTEEVTVKNYAACY